MSTSPFLTLHELVKKARQKLNHDNWDYIVGGAETETTVKRNRLALDSIAFRPRVLRDVSHIDASTKFLGRALRLPVVLAPVGGLELFAPVAGGGAVKAAEEFGVAHMLSSVCEPGLEAVAQAAPGALRIFQLYVRDDARWVDAMAERAIAAGYAAFCLTVDTAYYSRRERDLAKRNIRHQGVRGREFQTRLSWSDVATKPLGKGTGLGLATSLAIVKSHGGFIRMESEPGAGTKAHLYFPALVAPAAQQPPPAAESSLPRGRGETVLVVDDEDSIRQITRQALAAFGYRVLVASDGSEAVAIYGQRGSEIDVVLTDMMMPVMDGAATIQALRRLNPAVRIVGASGLTTDGQAPAEVRADIAHFLPKPYTAETLLKTIRAALDQ